MPSCLCLKICLFLKFGLHHLKEIHGGKFSGNEQKEEEDICREGLCGKEVSVTPRHRNGERLFSEREAGGSNEEMNEKVDLGETEFPPLPNKERERGERKIRSCGRGAQHYRSFAVCRGGGEKAEKRNWFLCNFDLRPVDFVESECTVHVSKGILIEIKLKARALVNATRASWESCSEPVASICNGNGHTDGASYNRLLLQSCVCHKLSAV